MSGYSRPADPGKQQEALHGSPQFLGTITSTTTKNNSNTAVPFTIPLGAYLLVAADAACNIRGGTVSTLTVTTANGIPVAAGEKFTLILATDEAYVACVGSANLGVWQLK